MPYGRLAVTAAALAAAAAAASPAHGQATERFSLTGSRVAVHNVVGRVQVEPATGSAVVVEVTRGGAHADRLRIGTATAGGTESVRIAYPAGDLVYPSLGARSRSQVSVGRDGVYGDGARGSGRRVTVSGSGSGAQAWADVRILVPAGRTVVVHHAVGRVEVSGTEGELRVNTGSASVATTGTRGKLTLDTGSGGVSVQGAEGDLLVDTGSGGVRVSAVRGGRVSIDTGSGGVSGSGVTATELVVDTGSGSVTLDGVAARRVNVDTGSGRVRLGLTRNPDDVRIDTGSGGVTLTVPEGFGAQLTISTGSGGINVDLPVTTRRAGRNRLEGTVGDGRARVVIDTGSGGVRVRGG